MKFMSCVAAAVLLSSASASAQQDMGAIAGGRRIQLRWEVFNATNHPSYGLPTTNLLSPDFGTIRGTVGSPRQMQFGLKFIY